MKKQMIIGTLNSLVENIISTSTETREEIVEDAIRSPLRSVIESTIYDTPAEVHPPVISHTEEVNSTEISQQEEESTQEGANGDVVWMTSKDGQITFKLTNCDLEENQITEEVVTVAQGEDDITEEHTNVEVIHEVQVDFIEEALPEEVEEAQPVPPVTNLEGGLPIEDEEIDDDEPDYNQYYRIPLRGAGPSIVFSKLLHYPKQQRDLEKTDWFPEYEGLFLCRGKLRHILATLSKDTDITWTGLGFKTKNDIKEAVYKGKGTQTLNLKIGYHVLRPERICILTKEITEAEKAALEANQYFRITDDIPMWTRTKERHLDVFDNLDQVNMVECESAPTFNDPEGLFLCRGLVRNLLKSTGRPWKNYGNNLINSVKYTIYSTTVNGRNYKLKASFKANDRSTCLIDTRGTWPDPCPARGPRAHRGPAAILTKGRKAGRKVHFHGTEEKASEVFFSHQFSGSVTQKRDTDFKKDYSLRGLSSNQMGKLLERFMDKHRDLSCDLCCPSSQDDSEDNDTKEFFNEASAEEEEVDDKSQVVSRSGRIIKKKRFSDEIAPSTRKTGPRSIKMASPTKTNIQCSAKASAMKDHKYDLLKSTDAEPTKASPARLPSLSKKGLVKTGGKPSTGGNSYFRLKLPLKQSANVPYLEVMNKVLNNPDSLDTTPCTWSVASKGLFVCYGTIRQFFADSEIALKNSGTNQRKGGKTSYYKAYDSDDPLSLKFFQNPKINPNVMLLHVLIPSNCDQADRPIKKEKTSKMGRPKKQQQATGNSEAASEPQVTEEGESMDVGSDAEDPLDGSAANIADGSDYEPEDDELKDDAEMAGNYGGKTRYFRLLGDLPSVDELDGLAEILLRPARHLHRERCQWRPSVKGLFMCFHGVRRRLLNDPAYDWELVSTKNKHGIVSKLYKSKKDPLLEMRLVTNPSKNKAFLIDSRDENGDQTVPNKYYWLGDDVDDYDPQETLVRLLDNLDDVDRAEWSVQASPGLYACVGSLNNIIADAGVEIVSTGTKVHDGLSTTFYTSEKMKDSEATFNLMIEFKVDEPGSLLIYNLGKDSEKNLDQIRKAMNASKDENADVEKETSPEQKEEKGKTTEKKEATPEPESEESSAIADDDSTTPKKVGRKRKDADDSTANPPTTPEAKSPRAKRLKPGSSPATSAAVQDESVETAPAENEYFVVTDTLPNLDKEEAVAETVLRLDQVSKEASTWTPTSEGVFVCRGSYANILSGSGARWTTGDRSALNGVTMITFMMRGDSPKRIRVSYSEKDPSLLLLQNLGSSSTPYRLRK